MDIVFRALADPTRRGLLDELLRIDGQTLGELSRRLTMTRFGVMKHLRTLEEAGLIITKKSGREKLHYISAVPIQQLPEHWIDRYRGQSELASGANVPGQAVLERRSFEYYIKATPTALWGAITDPEVRWKFSFGVQVFSDWTTSSYYAGCPIGHPELKIFEGKNINVEPGVRLIQTYHALWSAEVKALGSTRVSWLIDQIEDSCRLTLIHDQLPANPRTTEISGGWPMLLSGLKTLLETGEILTTPASIQYFGPTNALINRHTSSPAITTNNHLPK